MNAGKRRVRALERGITWRPHHDSHHVLADMFASARLVFPLCITQRTLLAVEAHLRRPGAPCQYGLLVGELCLHPETRSPYVLIDGSLDCPPPNDWRNLNTQLGSELSLRIGEAERARHVVIGYYRSAAVVVPRPSPADVALFQELFAQPWQVMLVRDGQPDGGNGAFIRVEPIHRRPYAAPFIELLPKGCKVRGAPPSALTWSNYDPAEPVTRLPALADGAAPATAREPPGSIAPRRILEVVRGLAGAPRHASNGASPPVAGPPRLEPTPRRAATERIPDIAIVRPVVPAADAAPPSQSSDAGRHPSPWDALPRPRTLSVGTAGDAAGGKLADAVLAATIGHAPAPSAGAPPAAQVPVVRTAAAHAASAPTPMSDAERPLATTDERPIDVPRDAAGSTAARAHDRSPDERRATEPIGSSVIPGASGERRPSPPAIDAAHAPPRAVGDAPALAAPTFPMLLPADDEAAPPARAPHRVIAAAVAVLVLLVVIFAWVT